jgi:hypothetical protein
VIFNKFDFIEDFFPNSPYAFILFLFLFFLISTLLVLIVAKFVNKNKSFETKTGDVKQLTLDDLIEIVSKEDATSDDLIFAINYFNKDFNVKFSPDKAFTFFKLLLSHKNRNKEIFNLFHNETLKSNKEFESQLNKIERECLNR